MTIKKKSLLSTLNTTKKAIVAGNPAVTVSVEPATKSPAKVSFATRSHAKKVLAYRSFAKK